MNIIMSNVRFLNSAHSTMHWALAEFVENAIHEIQVIDTYFDEQGDEISLTDEHNAGEHRATLIDFVIDHIEAMRDLTQPMGDIRHIPARREMMIHLAEYPVIWRIYIRQQRRVRRSRS